VLRTIIWLLVSVLLIAFIRGVVGVLAKGVQQLFQEEQQQARATRGRPGRTDFGGELVKDPVCGVFVSQATAVKKIVGGQTRYFCSEGCRDKFNA
jgi:YHS domain-containing protein